MKLQCFIPDHVITVALFRFFIVSQGSIKKKKDLIFGCIRGIGKELLLVQLSVPGLVSPNMTLDDDCFLFEELEIPPAEEASDVPLNGDGGPGLGAAPLIFQLLIKELLEKNLIRTQMF